MKNEDIVGRNLDFVNPIDADSNRPVQTPSKRPMSRTEEEGRDVIIKKKKTMKPRKAETFQAVNV